ncbi:endolytic transglycosylase MltG [Oceanobacillus halotolerans]|uniref:endolytic transglycosylase MltG n=1 Tax=Oceanobacillus halotolerans TaxID=2663380 RepID=UPI0013DB2EBC|nr:endolytic transglycosylase MltG [Oceanobacillus halotolerans]
MTKRKKTGDYKENLITRSQEAETVRKIVAIIILALVLILVIGGISAYMFIKSSLEPVDPDSDEEIQVEIPMGSSSSDIAEILEENGVINNALIFRFYTKFKNESDFQAGEYTFTPSLTIDEIIESLKNGTVLKEAIYTVTVPEGKTLEQIADIFEKSTPIEADAFLERVNDEEYIEQLMDQYPSFLTEEILNIDIKMPLEGYLFAATYSIYEENPSIDSIIETMLSKTESVLSSYLDDITASDLTIHEAITMASLVEKEASTEDQRSQIAGVFYNRMDIGMKLQTDPTVLYALGEHKEKIYLKDLEVESPYNTYYIDGLPVGPISNFAESSLEAILYPEESDYLYFLHDSEGNIHYSETDDEHEQLKSQYID